ncbi:hypothetical protein PIB30_032110 [Stylosanthes scabra]|uniref:AAA+ ATPase domain-containing protein n=1 Tax=Stylosanthes scabra TaxID=79078 RepID=A0ABU6UAV7_9FABA|nr:hypothetical protein [Stylosanthes scabra]
MKESNNNANDVQVQVRFSDLGGIMDLLEELAPASRQFLRKQGLPPVTRILLRGPPGCGKTTLARAIANETGFPFYQISAIEFVSGVSGPHEENIRELFAKASSTAPSIVFIDDFDVIDSERIVKQLRISMDHHSNLLLIRATNKLNFLDPALRSSGLFEKEFALGIPDEKAREEILTVHAKKLEGSVDFKEIAKCTAGYVGSDLVRVVGEAGRLLMRRIICKRKRELAPDHPLYLEDQWKKPWLPNDVDKLGCTMSDFQEAVKKVQPSLVREGFFSSVPNVKLEDIGGLDHLKEMFRFCIIEVIKHPELFEQTGVGILVYGPPCGKTLIAKAVVNAAGANFIHIKVDVLTTTHSAKGGSAGSRVLSTVKH